MSETIFHDLNSVDRNERIQVGSYRVDGHGHQKLKEVSTVWPSKEQSVTSVVSISRFPSSKRDFTSKMFWKTFARNHSTPVSFNESIFLALENFSFSLFRSTQIRKSSEESSRTCGEFPSSLADYRRLSKGKQTANFHDSPRIFSDEQKRRELVILLCFSLRIFSDLFDEHSSRHPVSFLETFLFDDELQR